jgi:hypothetical protein
MLACRMFGHRWRFAAEARRCAGPARAAAAPAAGNATRPPNAPRAARALDRDDRDDLGRRPLLSLLPLGLRRARRDGGRRRQ